MPPRVLGDIDPVEGSTTVLDPLLDLIGDGLDMHSIGAAFAYQKQEDEINRQRKHFKKRNNKTPTADEEQRFEDNGFYTCFDFLLRHLQHGDVDLIPKIIAVQNSTGPKLRQLDVLLTCLTGEGATSQDLKLVTEEAIAWLSYARRFIRKDADDGGDDDSD